MTDGEQTTHGRYAVDGYVVFHARASLSPLAPASSSSQLFAVFLVSIITLVIVPYTAYLLFGGDDDSVRSDYTFDLAGADVGMRGDSAGNRNFG
jgi:hypothetical protein